MKSSFFVIMLVVSGCAATGAADKDSPTRSETIFVRVFPVEKPEDLFLGYDKKAEPSDGVTYLERTCFSGPGARAAALPGAIFSALVGSGLKLAVEAIGSKLERELEAYSATIKGTYGGIFKLTGNSSPASCWRITRGRLIRNGKSKNEVLDFDATIALVARANALAVMPLRLTLNSPAPVKESRSDQYGVAVSLRMEVATNDGIEEVFNTLALSDSVKPNVTKYYRPNDKTKECGKNNDLDIFCGKQNGIMYVSSIPSGSLVGVTATVVETGAPSRFLKFLSQVLSGAEEDIGTALADAAAAKIEPESE